MSEFQKQSLEIYKDRRNLLMQKLGYGVLVLAGARLATRNSDCTYPFRQNSDFFYLTGFDEPDATLIITNAEDTGVKTTLIVPPKNKEKEIWDGFREGVLGAKQNYGFDFAYSNEELAKALEEKFLDHKTLYYNFDLDLKTDELVKQTLNYYKTLKRKNPVFPREIKFFKENLGDLRQIKSVFEVEQIKACVEVTKKANFAVMQALKPNMYEYEIEAILDYEYKRHGGTYGYSHIVAGGYNATCLHYTANDQKLVAGSGLLIDSGCELPSKFTADVTRCYPVGGRFSDKFKAIYNIVLEANKRAIARCIVGSSIKEVHFEAQLALSEGLIKLGVLKGKPLDLINNGDLAKFYMHGTSHWLGLDVHDAGRYDEFDGEPVKFKAGMLLTVEPGLYFRKEYSGLDTPYEGIGVRIEDNILISEAGPINLTIDIPKETSEIEAIMQVK